MRGQATSFDTVSIRSTYSGCWSLNDIDCLLFTDYYMSRRLKRNRPLGRDEGLQGDFSLLQEELVLRLVDQVGQGPALNIYGSINQVSTRKRYPTPGSVMIY